MGTRSRRLPLQECRGVPLSLLPTQSPLLSPTVSAHFDCSYLSHVICLCCVFKKTHATRSKGVSPHWCVCVCSCVYVCTCASARATTATVDCRCCAVGYVLVSLNKGRIAVAVQDAHPHLFHDGSTLIYTAHARHGIVRCLVYPSKANQEPSHEPWGGSR